MRIRTSSNDHNFLFYLFVATKAECKSTTKPWYGVIWRWWHVWMSSPVLFCPSVTLLDNITYVMSQSNLQYFSFPLHILLSTKYSWIYKRIQIYSDAQTYPCLYNHKPLSYNIYTNRCLQQCVTWSNSIVCMSLSRHCTVPKMGNKMFTVEKLSAKSSRHYDSITVDWKV